MGYYCPLEILYTALVNECLQQQTDKQEVNISSMCSMIKTTQQQLSQNRQSQLMSTAIVSAYTDTVRLHWPHLGYSLYFTMDRVMSPNWPFHCRIRPRPPSSTWFTAPTEVHIPNGTSICLNSCFCRAHGCDRPTDRQTDRHTHRPWNTGNNRFHLVS